MTKAIPTSNYDFAHLIEQKMNYVDKTEYLHRLAVSENNCFFLSRPRRFGKSLMISTFKYIFEGRRDLFEGLKIEATNYDWQVYPVVHLNMADMKGDSVLSIEKSLLKSLKEIAAQHTVTIDPSDKLGDIFRDILKRCASQSPTGKVVLLIDEYDALMVSCIGEPHFEEVRNMMAGFYEKIKSANSILRFTMITGVTRFPKVSVFSALNHMTDLSLDSDYATMLGYTQEEVEFYFGERLSELAQQEGMGEEAYRESVRQWYNGFRFVPQATTVYNPVSTGLFLKHGIFDNYWFETGSPTFLIDQLKKRGSNFFELLDEEVSTMSLNSFDIVRMDAKSLLFQSGYLTINSARKDGVRWRIRLDFPNHEVEESFETFLASGFGVEDPDRVTNDAFRLRDCVREGNTPRFVALLHAHLAAIPYESNPMTEACFKSILFSLFRLVGLYCIVEQHTNKGRIDTVVESEEHIYVIEYKYNKSSAASMAQIHEKGYSESFRERGKQIHLLGLNYDPTARNIANDWLEELC